MSGDVCLQSLRQCEVCALYSGRVKCIVSTTQIFLALKDDFMNSSYEKYLGIFCSSHTFCVKACCKSVSSVSLEWNFSLYNMLMQIFDFTRQKFCTEFCIAFTLPIKVSILLNREQRGKNNLELDLSDLIKI